MLKNKRIMLLFALALLTLVMTATASLYNQSQNDSTSARQDQIDKSRYPIADYRALEPADLQKRALRRRRNSHYDIHDKNIDARSFVLNEQSPEGLIQLEESHPSIQPAFPLAQSDAVVIGEITDAQAYLSNDKTTVYSEFAVRLGEVIKNNSFESLFPSAVIATDRIGGRVRLPSGKILFRGGGYGRNMPQVGCRYVLFLKHNDDGQNFSIITGYELRAGHVYALDGVKGSYKSPQFVEYERYEGSNETLFLQELRSFIKGAQE